MPKTLIILGSILAVLGVVCFLALFGSGQTETIRALGSACFAGGTLLAAAGVYLQAREIIARYEQPVSKARKTERLCASCNQEPALVFCRVHVLRLCLGCMEKHDDGAHCSYVPAQRATAAYK